jgi:hypothetical protein
MPTTIAGIKKQHKLGDIKLHRVISVVELLHSNIIMNNTNGRKGKVTKVQHKVAGRQHTKAGTKRTAEEYPLQYSSSEAEAEAEAEAEDESKSETESESEDECNRGGGGTATGDVPKNGKIYRHAWEKIN